MMVNTIPLEKIQIAMEPEFVRLKRRIYIVVLLSSEGIRCSSPWEYVEMYVWDALTCRRAILRAFN
jgi:hypothetical protein